VNAERSGITLLFRSLANRARLLALETEQVGDDLLGFAVLAGIVATLGVGTVVGLHVLLLALVWESEYRGLITGVVVALEAGLCLWAAIFFSGRIRGWEPFGATREQCEKDSVWIEKLLNQQDD